MYSHLGLVGTLVCAWVVHPTRYKIATVTSMKIPCFMLVYSEASQLLNIPILCLLPVGGARIDIVAEIAAAAAGQGLIGSREQLAVRIEYPEQVQTIVACRRRQCFLAVLLPQ